MVATGSEAMALSTATRSDKSFLQRTGSAYLWPGKEAANDNERTLEGELEVGRTLKPSFLFPRLSIQVSLPNVTLHHTAPHAWVVLYPALHI